MLARHGCRTMLRDEAAKDIFFREEWPFQDERTLINGPYVLFLFSNSGFCERVGGSQNSGQICNSRHLSKAVSPFGCCFVPLLWIQASSASNMFAIPRSYYCCVRTSALVLLASCHGFFVSKSMNSELQLACADGCSPNTSDISALVSRTQFTHLGQGRRSGCSGGFQNHGGKKMDETKGSLACGHHYISATQLVGAEKSGYSCQQPHGDDSLTSPFPTCLVLDNYT